MPALVYRMKLCYSDSDWALTEVVQPARVKGINDYGND